MHLERATQAHVQTFARLCEPEEHELAGVLGWPGVEEMYLDLLNRSSEAFAMVGEVPVLAMLGVLPLPLPLRARLWMHMPPVFKEGGFSALRIARQLIDRLLVQYRELHIDIEASKPELVRMADWLGFRVHGRTEKLGRHFHCCVLRERADGGKARVA